MKLSTATLATATSLATAHVIYAVIAWTAGLVHPAVIFVLLPILVPLLVCLAADLIFRARRRAMLRRRYRWALDTRYVSSRPLSSSRNRRRTPTPIAPPIAGRLPAGLIRSGAMIRL